ncbi:hypothetical protein AB5N19_11956 [Seiridium cardinale]
MDEQCSSEENLTFTEPGYTTYETTLEYLREHTVPLKVRRCFDTDEAVQDHVPKWLHQLAPARDLEIKDIYEVDKELARCDLAAMIIGLFIQLTGENTFPCAGSKRDGCSGPFDYCISLSLEYIGDVDNSYLACSNCWVRGNKSNCSFVKAALSKGSSLGTEHLSLPTKKVDHKERNESEKLRE